jgi:hypothetical protein
MGVDHGLPQAKTHNRQIGPWGRNEVHRSMQEDAEFRGEVATSGPQALGGDAFLQSV